MHAANIDVGGVPLYHAVEHGEPQPCALLPIGGKGWLQTTAASVLVHAYPTIAKFDVDAGVVRRGARTEGYEPAGRHRVDRVEHQVGERVAYLALDAHEVGQLRRQVARHLDDHAALLRNIAPTRTRQFDHLLHQSIHLNRRKRELRLAVPVELAHARDGLCNAVDGALNDLQVSAAPCAELRLALEQ